MKIFFLFYVSLLQAVTLSFYRKLTRDTSLTHFGWYLMGQPTTSFGLIRKDKNRYLTFIGDAYWHRVLLIRSSDLERLNISAYEQPKIPNYFEALRGVTVDTNGYLFITNSSKCEILKCKYDWQRDTLFYIGKFSYNIFPIGIAVMANDSLCPERCFWVCDSIFYFTLHLILID